MSNYAIACVLSGITACFTVWSSWVPDSKKSFTLQIFQCLTYAVASIFFGVYSSSVTMVLCAFRNYLVVKNRFTKKWCIAFCILVAVIGLACNNAGFKGTISIAATIQYALCCLFMTSLLATKWNILINLALWIAYDLSVLDFISGGVDGVSLLVTAAAIIRITKMNKNEKSKINSFKNDLNETNEN